MANQLDNTEFMGENSTYHGVVSPADNLGQGIKRIAEILEVNGIPKYKIGEVIKSLGASIKVNGQEVTSLEFDSDPQTQFDTIRQDLTTAENQIGDLDGTKQDKDVALIHVDLGIQDLKNNQSFPLPKAKIDALASNLTALAEISDNITGRHRFFVRTSISADASLITMCEVVDMGTKKAPSINELEISVAEMKATYMEMALQPRLTQIDLDNIASIPQLKPTLIANFGVSGQSSFTTDELSDPFTSSGLYKVEYKIQGYDVTQYAVISVAYSTGENFYTMCSMSNNIFDAGVGSDPDVTAWRILFKIEGKLVSPIYQKETTFGTDTVTRRVERGYPQIYKIWRL